MSKGQEFYVGWQDKMPQGMKSFLRYHIVILFLFIPLLSFTIVALQKEFNDHSFTFGKVETFTGIYHAEPAPILELMNLDAATTYSAHALLVGYGKFGAEGIIEKIEANNSPLDGREITIQGTLIQGDGRAVIELTEKENSLVSIEDATNLEFGTVSFKQDFTAIGEILDPKCYFGVMKPGEGKIHRSCAIRCISGGIPPVFRVRVESEGDNKYNYFVLLGLNGEKINKEILQLIGLNVQISGSANFHNGWNVIYSNPSTITIVK